MKHIIWLCLFVLIFGNCKSQQDRIISIPSGVDGITYLDSTAAVSQILQDEMDGFFESLSEVELSIQLKSETKYDSKKTALESYKQMLVTEMGTFSQEEKELMTSAFTEAKRIMDKVNPDLWPSNIEIIKTKTNHYGPDVYYTREDAIVIPENIFAQKATTEGILSVMLHEIYHILSRYHENFREETYALIDFQKHNQEVKLSPTLQRRRLTNPDGVTLDYGIKLNDESGKEQLVVPFLISSQQYYDQSIPSFFSYLKFDLYPLIEQANGKSLLVSDTDGNTPLSAEMQNDYFNHIGDNTQYVIHPDEVMADNFMLALLAYDTGEYSEFSKSGKKLIDEVLEVLKGYKN